MVSWLEWYFQGNKPLCSELARKRPLPPEPSRELRYSRRLDAHRPGSVASVYEAKVGKHLRVVKCVGISTETLSSLTSYQFKPYTREHAIRQCEKLRLPVTQDNISRVSKDADPFLCELRAYEQIEECCPLEERSQFLAFYGTVEEPKSDRCLSFESDCHQKRGIVLAPFDDKRRLKPALSNQSIPDDLDSQLADMTTDVVALRYYREVYAERKKNADILHGIGIIHGDFVNDNLQAPGNIYDVEPHDFSLSYTYSDSAPTLMAGRARLMPFHEARQMDHDALLESVLELAKEKVFENRLAELLKGRRQSAHADIEHSANQCQILVLRQVSSRKDYLFFPSFASLMPLLEQVISKLGEHWIRCFVQTLDDYIALWTTDKPGFQKTIKSGSRVPMDSTWSSDTLFNITLVPPRSQADLRNICHFLDMSDSSEAQTVQIFDTDLFKPKTCDNTGVQAFC